MKKQEYTIECGRCGESRREFLSVEEAGKLSDGVEPIYRECERCEKTTGWISSACQSPASEEPASRPLPPAQNQPLKGQERMATQAERDNVNSIVHNNAQPASKD